MKCCVIGAGSGGRAFSAYLSSKGHEVNLYNRSYSRLAAIRKFGGIQAEGELNGFFPIHRASQSISDVIKGTKLILVVTPASAHRSIAKKIAPFLERGQLILLNPGRTFGSTEFVKIIEDYKGKFPFYVCETQTLLFTSRALEKNRVLIYKIKDNVKISTFPEKYTEFFYEGLKGTFPQLEPAEDYLDVTLNNIGMFLHPAISLFNASAIDNAKEIKFYSEGASDRVCQVLESLEFEINQIFKKIGLKQFRFTQWANQCYGVDCNRIYDTLQNIDIYQNINAPKQLITRYFTEDVPTGLVPLASIAELLGIDVPTINSIIHLSSLLCGRDFQIEGRTIENLGLKEYILQEMRERGRFYREIYYKKPYKIP